jgi:hypothetical protein
MSKPTHGGTQLVSFGQTRIDAVNVNETVEPKLSSLESFRFIAASSGPIMDELTVAYQSVEGDWYQTVVTRNSGRWSDYKQHVLLSRPHERSMKLKSRRAHTVDSRRSSVVLGLVFAC